MQEEVWRPIAGVEGYEVSNLGRVRSFKKKTMRIMGQFFYHGGNYLSVYLITGGVSKRNYFAVHRLVAQAFISNPENKPMVNHINGVKTDNRAENLEWCTQSENMQHAVRIGIIKTGEDCHQAKLTNEQALYVRNNPENLTLNQLGKMFGITPNAARAIQTGKAYKYLGGNIRKPREYVPPMPSYVREEIRRLYVKGSKDFNCYTLGKKFGYNPTTIFKIVKGL